SGRQDVVIGTPTANRGRVEIENLIGFFVNTLAWRVDLSGSPTVGELLELVKRQAIAAQQYQDIPFEQVVEIVKPGRSLAHNPVFQVAFAWQNVPRSRLELAAVEVGQLESVPPTTSKFDVMLLLKEAGERIAGGLEYATALFQPATIGRYAGYYRALLAAMVENDSQAVDALPMLGEAERQQVVEEWNRTGMEVRSAAVVHELFQ